MKKLLVLFVLLSVLFVAGCGGGQTNAPQDPVPTGTETQAASGKKIPPFSFAQESKQYTEGASGVKTEGFVNVSASPINSKQEAEERAKNECTIEWDTVETFYDSEAVIWKVVFGKWNVAGGDESVYLDQNGITLLIVYGE